MGRDVVADGGGQGAVTVRIVEVATEVGGADVDVETGEQVKGRCGSGGVAQQGAAEVDAVGRGRGRLGEFDAGGQKRSKIRKRLTRARGDDERGDEGDFCAPMPAGQAKEGVGANKTEEFGRGWQGVAEGQEGVDCVVGPRSGSVDEGELEGRLIGDGQACHGNPVIKRSCRAFGL